MSKKPKPCSDCGERPKQPPRHFCRWCILKRQPMHVQAEAAKKRLEAVPEALRLKRSQKIVKDDTPDGLAFCAGCQTFCPDWMFAKSATQCRPCANAKAHANRTQKTYGISDVEYAEILHFQGGKCAICRGGFKTTRGAVDHVHKGDNAGKVRGILCSRCNWEALGSLHDDLGLAQNAMMYLETPPAMLRAMPAMGTWEGHLERRREGLTSQAARRPVSDDQGSGKASPFTTPGKPAQKRQEPVQEPGSCFREHFLPSGSEPIPGKRGVYRVFTSDQEDTDHPF